MNFHPDKNLPGCMMPDGGDCCAGHAAVVEDWHKQRREIERLRAALTRISNGGTAVLISAALDECPINPEVLEQIVKDAVAALPPSCTCGGDTGQPASHHDISCPSAISSTEGK